MNFYNFFCTIVFCCQKLTFQSQKIQTPKTPTFMTQSSLEPSCRVDDTDYTDWGDNDQHQRNKETKCEQKDVVRDVFLL